MATVNSQIELTGAVIKGKARGQETTDRAYSLTWVEISEVKPHS